MARTSRINIQLDLDPTNRDQVMETKGVIDALANGFKDRDEEDDNVAPIGVNTGFGGDDD